MEYVVLFTGLLCLTIGLILIGSYFLKKRSLYKQMGGLSSNLRKICNGDYSLDIRDNEEGELSILKNEIYKVTLMLSEQRNLYKNDQERLAEAIADISHQLKTPLTSMTVMADLLSNHQLSSERRVEFTRHIQIQVERMDWLLSSLLKLSKIDAGTVIFRKDIVNVSNLIEQVKNQILIPMEIKNQTLEVQGDVEVSFQGDLKWTVEALINILKNCIEHTHENGLILINFIENPLYTEISMKDNGKGIAKEDIPYIFKRFYRGKNAGTDSVGIGLAMAKSIINGQNGDLTVDSQEGQGSTFSIKFYKQNL